ncbi:MAG: hypothetical protein ACI87O_000813, partial [Planctomycetota bacterium]
RKAAILGDRCPAFYGRQHLAKNLHSPLLTQAEDVGLCVRLGIPLTLVFPPKSLHSSPRAPPPQPNLPWELQDASSSDGFGLAKSGGRSPTPLYCSLTENLCFDTVHVTPLHPTEGQELGGNWSVRISFWEFTSSSPMDSGCQSTHSLPRVSI